MKTLRVFSLGILLAALFFVVPHASAHRPGWGSETGQTHIENLSTSFAFYRDLKPASQVDVYVFEGKAGEHLHAGIQIPAIRGLELYGVTMALFGPGLPEPDEAALPAQHPEGLGASLFPSAPGEDFFEPFTQTNYWGRQRIEMDLPASGTYYLLVWNPQGLPGKYVMDTGEAEVFGAMDIFRFPVWWLQVHTFYGQGPVMLAIASLLAAAAALAAGAVILARRPKPALVPVRVKA